jgi:predicted anti-sigma-YlaC factor YlaD
MKEPLPFHSHLARLSSLVWTSLYFLFTPAEVVLLRHCIENFLEFCSGHWLAGSPVFLSRSRGFADRRHFGGFRLQWTALLLACLVLLSGCSVRKFAVNKLGDSLANSGTTFASDNDPEFVGQAVPFSLKLIEGLLAESPKHRGLLFAAASGFTQYSYVYVQEPSEEIESVDLEKSATLRTRSRNLYLRARDYGLRGLDAKHPGFTTALSENPKFAVRSAKLSDVPLLYWTAVAWGAAISLSKDHPDLVAQQPQVEALIDRAYALDPTFEHGAIDQFLISYESARQGTKEDFSERCWMHFDRAVRLSDKQLASPYVSFAETVSVQKQNRAEFESMLHQALSIDPDVRPEWRLSNLIMQRRARWLLSREDELFLEQSKVEASQ